MAVKAKFFIVLYNEKHERIHESLPFDEYPSEESIDFGMSDTGVSYAIVEKRHMSK
jgi:hypothetical protein